ncbi:MAG: transcription termination/antitermination protein NusA [Clostridiales bacterium]|nr:transcription termination/antitermination protein NusA [Clostridiales bacterium]
MARKKKQEEEEKLSIVDAVKALAKERSIDEEEVFEAMEVGIVAAYKKEFGKGKQEFNCVECEIDRETGEIYVYKVVEIVDEVLDPLNEISLDEAIQLGYDDVEIGDEIELAVDVKDLGYLAAGAAKNAIASKVKESEGVKIKAEYQSKIGQIVSGRIVSCDNKAVMVNLGRAEAILPKEEQTRNERYDRGATMKFLVKRIEDKSSKTTVILSRKSDDFVRKLFEMEVDEIRTGKVTIERIAREPGSRTKIAVYSRDENIDAKGSCVGPHGIRVQAVIDELNHEKIDIVDFNTDEPLFISEALQPAQVMRVDTEIAPNEETGELEKSAVVVVPDDQYSLAIGRGGQNVRLAVRLTGFKIDIKRESEESSESVKSLIDDFTVVEEIPEEESAPEANGEQEG